MEKRVKTTMLVIGLTMLVSACGNNSDTISETNTSIQETNRITSMDYETIALNDIIATDFCEIVLTNSIISHAVTNTELGLTLDAEADSVHIVFLGSIKNKAANEIDMLSGFEAQILVDKKYNYKVTVFPNDVSSIVPLQTTQFAAYVTVPDEVIDSCESYEFQFGFNNEFAYDYTVKNGLEGKEYKYKISGKVDEYGSADSIQNLQTFTEYVSSFISKSEYNENFKVTGNKASEIVTIEDGNCLKFASNDGVEVSIYPYLELRYFAYELGVYQYGVLEMEVEGYRDADNQYYVSANTITLKSDAGQITIGEGLETTYDFNNVSATNVFHFDSGDLSLKEVNSIVNGNDLEINLDVKTMENEHLSISYMCDEKMQNTLIALLDVYQQMPNAQLSK